MKKSERNALIKRLGNDILLHAKDIKAHPNMTDYIQLHCNAMKLKIMAIEASLEERKAGHDE